MPKRDARIVVGEIIAAADEVAGAVRRYERAKAALATAKRNEGKLINRPGTWEEANARARERNNAIVDVERAREQIARVAVRVFGTKRKPSKSRARSPRASGTTHPRKEAE